MCGICGFISERQITISKLKEMNDTMYHRGPNDSGEEIWKLSGGFYLGLAHRRLSILDLSSLGHQPMHSRNGQVSIVYNGEIYNYLELKKELGDYEFQSNCDTEVLLAAYLKWGIRFVDKLNGMFAIALFDRQNDTLYLMRDRIGKKPLYYWLDKDNIVFASECKPFFLTPGFEKKINTDILPRYFMNQYIEAPHSIFENVYKLEPGKVLEYRYGKIQQYKYWDIAEKYNQNKNKMIGSYADAKEYLKYLLSDATEKRMISDVPLGSFLSGGYDSSLITAIAQSRTNAPLKTFSIGFDDPSYNEAEYAKEVAKHLGTEHTELYINQQDMLALVSEIAKYYDEPFADSSQIPSMLVAKLAKEKVTVVLSGDGGDEFFCGYNIYPYVAQAQKLDYIGTIIYNLTTGKLFQKFNLIEKLPYKVRSIVKNRNINTKTQFGGENYEKKLNHILLSCNDEFKFEKEQSYKEENWQIIRMLLDQDTYLSGDILCKVDRATMHCSLEARCPILDYRVMEFSYQIPHKYKFFKGDKKHILKDLAYDYIPRQLLDRPKKGFGVPLDNWLRGPLKEQLLEYTNADLLKKQGIFDAEATRILLYEYLDKGDAGASTGANYSRIVWPFFVFQQWYQMYYI